MFTKLGQFLDKDDGDRWHVKRPPMRYTNARGEDFVVMAARHYEELTGEDSNRLQAYEVFDNIKDTDELNVFMGREEDSPSLATGEKIRQNSNEGKSEPAKTDGGFVATTDSLLGFNLAFLPLEDDIHLEDLPL